MPMPVGKPAGLNAKFMPPVRQMGQTMAQFTPQLNAWKQDNPWTRFASGFAGGVRNLRRPGESVYAQKQRIAGYANPHPQAQPGQPWDSIVAGGKAPAMQPKTGEARRMHAVLTKLAQLMGPPAPKQLIRDQLQAKRDDDERRLNASSSANRWSRFFHNPLSLLGANGGINAGGGAYAQARAALGQQTGTGSWLDRAQELGGLSAGFRDWRATGSAQHYLKPGHGDRMADLVARQREALNLDAVRRSNRALSQLGQLKGPEDVAPKTYNPYPKGWKPDLYARDYYSARYE